MSEPVANDYAAIAARLREIKGEPEPKPEPEKPTPQWAPGDYYG